MQSLVGKPGGFCVLHPALRGDGSTLLECFSNSFAQWWKKNEILTCYVGLPNKLE